MVYRFVFTSVRTGPYDGVQLGAIALLGFEGDLLHIDTISNPGGLSPGAQGPERLIDYQSDAAGGSLTHEVLLASNEGKWYDGSFAAAGESQLLVNLSTAQSIGGYRLLTANDNPRRDPTSWRLEAVLSDGSRRLLHTVSSADPPSSRGTLYSGFYLVEPPPLLPPSAS